MWDARGMTRVGKIVAVAVAIVAIPLLVMALLGVSWRELRHFGEPRNVVKDDGVTRDIPFPEGPARRLLPQVSATASTDFTFMTLDPAGAPVRWDPCRPVPWVLSSVGMPRLAEPLVQEAVDNLQDATGLQFEFRGMTDEVASFERPLFQERYGDGFAPVIVGWSTAAATPELVGTVSGIGGSRALPGAYGSQRYLRTGTVIIDGDDVRTQMATTAGQAHVTAIVMHELAHVLGLGHVDDPSQLMYATYDAQSTLGAGDLAGLALAGAGPCEP